MCDIWVDREPGSCGGATEKSPSVLLFPVLLRINNKKKWGDLVVCVTTMHCCKRGERLRETRDISVYRSIILSFLLPEDGFIGAACF